MKCTRLGFAAAIAALAGEIFALCDRDGDGHLSREELVWGVRRLVKAEARGDTRHLPPHRPGRGVQGRPVLRSPPGQRRGPVRQRQRLVYYAEVRGDEAKVDSPGSLVSLENQGMMVSSKHLEFDMPHWELKWGTF